ncbi:MAG: MucBP domain-containing protein [Clostridia bacterium]|nr:MucBP domain-containing protein [Clostridia bacterium]
MKKLSKKTVAILVILTIFFSYIMPIVPVQAANSLTHDYNEISSLENDYSYGTLYWTDDTEISFIEDENNTNISQKVTIFDTDDYTQYLVNYNQWAANHNKMIGLKITNCAIDKDGDMCDVICKITNIQVFDDGEDRGDGTTGVADMTIGKYINSNLIEIWFDANAASGHFTMQYVKHGTNTKANITHVVSTIMDLDAIGNDSPSRRWGGAEGFTIDGANGEVYYKKGRWITDVEGEKGVRVPNASVGLDGKVENNNYLDLYSSAVTTEELTDATYKLFYSGSGCGIGYVFVSPYNFNLGDPKKRVSKSVVSEGEVFNYKITQYVPNNYYADELNFIDDVDGKYTSFTLKDELNSNLKLEGTPTIKNENGKDATSLFNITTEGNTITASAKSQSLTNVNFYARSYTLNIPVSVKSGTGINVEKISNVATTVAVTRKNTETKTSNTVNTAFKYKEKIDATIDRGTTQIIDGTNIGQQANTTTYTKTVNHGDSTNIEVKFKADDTCNVKTVTIDDNPINLSDCTENDDGTYSYVISEKNINKDINHKVVITTEFKDAIVNVKYVDEDGKEIATPQILNGKINDEYTSTPKNIPNYELKETPKNASGKMTKDPIDVIYVYKLKDTSVVVKYIDTDTKKEIAESETINGKATQEYTTTAKTIDAYKLTDTPKNATGIMTEEPIEVIYYYTKKDASVVINYIDENGKQIADTENVTGKIGDTYTSKEKEIKGYILTKTPENANGTMKDEKTIVDYVYKTKDAKVIVKYVDSNNKEISESKTINGKYFEKYDTSGKTISGYSLKKTPENASGIMNEDEIIVTYVYEKKVTELPKTGNTKTIIISGIGIISIYAIVIKKILKSDKYRGY